MFGLFSKKTYQPTVTPEDKEWIEETIAWFIEVFGIDKLKIQPFILPTAETFPYDNLKDDKQFQKLFEQLCNYWDINPGEIVIKLFDDFGTKRWEILIPQGEVKVPIGFFQQIYTIDSRRFKIHIAKSNLDNPQLLISVIAHELAHVKLLGGKYVKENDPDLEPLADLASIFFGFGIFVANSVQAKDIYWISRTGYLPNQLISYANALICYIAERDADYYYPILNENTKDLFRQDFGFLINTNDTALNKEKISDAEFNFKINQQIEKGFEEREFDEVIEACTKLLEKNPRSILAFNNLGYALLRQKKYEEAIEQFTRAIAIEPFWDYPYNNRGYCKLQLGDIENAFTDLHHSFQMNPHNSFSWRNMGAFFLKTNELEEALHYFEEAEKIDPKTEMINFYLGHIYLKLGNIELGQKYLGKSKELNEHNDSATE